MDTIEEKILLNVERLATKHFGEKDGPCVLAMFEDAVRVGMRLLVGENTEPDLATAAKELSKKYYGDGYAPNILTMFQEAVRSGIVTAARFVFWNK